MVSNPYGTQGSEVDRTMRKVLLIGPLLPTGGVARYVKDLLSWSGRYQFVLFNIARPVKKGIKPGTGYKELLNAGPVRAMQGILITLGHMLAFPWVLIHSKADIVHICGVSYWRFWENAYYIFISKLLRRPVTLHYLGAFDIYYENRSNLERAAIRCVLRWPDKVIFLSHKVYALAGTFLPRSKLAVIPSNVDVTRFTQNCSSKLSEKDGIVRVLFVGGLDPFRKGVYDLLDAITLVIQEDSKIRFVISGSEGSFEPIMRRWHELKLERYIEFIGWISEGKKVEIYQSADILVLPSHNEGLPYVIIEALASGLPIIASSVGGIPEVIRHGENGYIIKPGDSQSLAKYILLLASKPELRKIIGKRNRERALEYYSLGAAFSQLEKLFDEVTEDR